MFVRQKTTAGSKSCPKSKRLSFVFDKLERDGHSSPSVYAIRPSVVPTIRVLCGVGGRAKSVARDDEAGVERAQRRVTQEAAEEDKGRREKRTSCWSFSQELGVFHAERTIACGNLRRGLWVGVDLDSSRCATSAIIPRGRGLSLGFPLSFLSSFRGSKINFSRGILIRFRMLQLA